MKVTIDKEITTIDGTPKELASFKKLVNPTPIFLPVRGQKTKVYAAGLDKTVFEIAVGDLSPKEAHAFVKRVEKQYKASLRESA